MRAFVFTDRSLTRRAGQFVWLSINTEKEKNAPFLKQFPVTAWPSFFIIDPAHEKIAIRWVGGATLAQLSKLLDDGRPVGRRAEPAGGGFPTILARADRLYGETDFAGAARDYREALSKAPAGWRDAPRVVDALLFSLASSGDAKGCARAALDWLPKLRHGSSAANVSASGLGCALELPQGDPDRKGLIAALEPATREVLEDRTLDMAADDRSGVYQALIDARDDAGDAEGKAKLIREWSAFLDGEAGKARSPQERTVFDSHRLSAYLELGEPERAIPMLEASERDFPDDYNPPARLALAYQAMKRYGDALAASDRALARAYGPRRIGILRTRSEIYAGKGDAKAARETLEQALREAEALPPGQRSDRMIAALKKKLEGPGAEPHP